MPVLMTLLFLGVVSSASLGLHFYLFSRFELLIRPSVEAITGTPFAFDTAVHWTLTGCFTALMSTYFLIGKFLSPRRFRWLAWCSGLWMGLFSLLLVWAAGFHLLEMLLQSLGTTLPPHTGLVPLAASLCMVAIGLKNALRPPKLSEVTLQPQSLPKSLSGLRIIQLSDIHIGPTIGREFLNQVVQTVQSRSPDLIVITGDLVDGEVPLLAEDVAPIFDLKAPLGVFFITGNHEFISGADPWVDHLRAGGITVLENESHTLLHNGTAFQLVGVEDWDSARFHPHRTPNLEQALKGTPKERFTLLLAHQPKAVKEASQKGVHVQLSGHTHGGQFAPFSSLVVLDQPYVSGLYTVDQTLLYVNEGTGYWGPPLRIGTRSEITELILQAS